MARPTNKFERRLSNKNRLMRLHHSSLISGYIVANRATYNDKLSEKAQLN